MAALQAYPWRGNVRELRNAVERAMLLAEGNELNESHFPMLSAAEGELSTAMGLPAEGINLEALERSLVVQALERSGWNQTKAATLLGLNRDQIRYRIEKFDLHKPSYGCASRVGRRRPESVSVIASRPAAGQSTAICPPCDSISRLAVAMPRPVPRALVVLNGRNSAARISAGMPGPESAISM